MDFAGRITSSRVYFSKFAHPHHSVYFYFTVCREHKDFFPCAVTALVHISHMTRASAVSARVWFHVTHPPASVMCGQSKVNL